MDNRQKKQWEKMMKQWEETRDLARTAAARDEARRAAQARAQQAQVRPPPRTDVPPCANPIPDVPTEQAPQHPPEGVTPPLCWCGDQCKFFKSRQRLSLGMRYWGCANYASDYPDRRFDTSTYRQPSPEPLCGYRNWIDVEIHPRDQWTLDFDDWNAARGREIREEDRRNDEQTERIRRETKAHLDACARREREARETERERKRQAAARAKQAADEFDAELARKGKWPRSTQ